MVIGFTGTDPTGGVVGPVGAVVDVVANAVTHGVDDVAGSVGATWAKLVAGVTVPVETATDETELVTTGEEPITVADVVVGGVTA